MISFLKGHGTENDFIIIPDTNAAVDLSASYVAKLCDRRAGIGADGILRVATAGALLRTGVLEALPPQVEESDWFMDYRNADGSIAEMCGNGVRVFAHYLVAYEGAQRSGLRVGTRAGLREVEVHAADTRNADVTVDMGITTVLGESTCTVGGQIFSGLGVDVGNPHLACVDPALTAESLESLELVGEVAPSQEMFPEGVNLEIVTPVSGSVIHMRVIERGAGETRSCGTGTVAAAKAALVRAGKDAGELTVQIPGGKVVVEIRPDGGATLTGPSVILAEGTVEL